MFHQSLAMASSEIFLQQWDYFKFLNKFGMLVPQLKNSSAFLVKFTCEKVFSVLKKGSAAKEKWL